MPPPVSTEVLLENLRAFADELGRTPKQREMTNSGPHSSTTYQVRFGSWNEAIRQAGLPLVRECESRGGEIANLTCEACGAEFERPAWKANVDRAYCPDCWGSTDVEGECAICGDSFTAKRVEGQRFCSYECMGEWRSGEFRGENHPRWRGGHDDYRGPNWPEQREKARERDDYTCQHCGIEESEIDGQLDVNHITPYDRFSDGESVAWQLANRLENLETLCRRCHLKADWEKDPARNQPVDAD